MDEFTDIIYLVTKEVGKGIIASRDYVDIRTHVQKDGNHIIASESVTHPSYPPTNGYIRQVLFPILWERG